MRGQTLHPRRRQQRCSLRRTLPASPAVESVRARVPVSVLVLVPASVCTPPPPCPVPPKCCASTQNESLASLCIEAKAARKARGAIEGISTRCEGRCSSTQDALGGAQQSSCARRGNCCPKRGKSKDSVHICGFWRKSASNSSAVHDESEISAMRRALHVDPRRPNAGRPAKLATASTTSSGSHTVADATIIAK